MGFNSGFKGLNSKKKKITAIKTLSVPVLVYSFGIVSWVRKELRR
jgi:hypothetical protein